MTNRDFTQLASNFEDSPSILKPDSSLTIIVDDKQVDLDRKTIGRLFSTTDGVRALSKLLTGKEVSIEYSHISMTDEVFVLLEELFDDVTEV